MSLRFLGQFLISESLQGDDDGGHDRECFSRYRRVIFLLSQGQPFIASRVLRSVADCSHSRSFDQRRRPETGLGRSLGVDITAEGIELQDQLVMLRAAGCTDGQGYLICRPKPASRIAEILSAPGTLIDRRERHSQVERFQGLFV
jgi:hypothetical protein